MARIVGVGEQTADVIAPPDVAVLRLAEEAREQRQRQRTAAKIMRSRPQLFVRPRCHCRATVRRPTCPTATRPVDGAEEAPLKRRMSATAARLVSKMRPGLEPGGAPAKRRSSARRPWSFS